MGTRWHTLLLHAGTESGGRDVMTYAVQCMHYCVSQLSQHNDALAILDARARTSARARARAHTHARSVADGSAVTNRSYALAHLAAVATLAVSGSG